MGNLSWVCFSFSGRLNRQPWWLWLIALSVVQCVLDGIIMASLGSNLAAIDPNDQAALVAAMWRLFAPMFVVAMVFLYPALAIYTKRWHDRGKSGWWTLILFVPIIGGIWAFIELGFLRGTVGANRYGPDPLLALASAF